MKFIWLRHRGERWTTWPNIYTGNLKVTCVSDQYNFNIYTSGPDVETTLYGEYDYGETQSFSWFHNVITKANWNATTDWAHIP